MNDGLAEPRRLPGRGRLNCALKGMRSLERLKGNKERRSYVFRDPSVSGEYVYSEVLIFVCLFFLEAWYFKEPY